MRTLIRFSALLALAVPLAAASKAPRLSDLQVFPAEINLRGAQDRQSLVVQAHYEDGVTRDVTSEASLSLASRKIARLEQAVLQPVADGRTELRVKFAGRSLVVPVVVDAASASAPVSFTRDVMPILTKAGCNSGGCHGSSRGKDGFHLSLFGYDPDGDHYRLTREAIGRRLNLAVPEESLLLEKSTNRVPHTGGERFKADTEFYRTVLAWVRAGAPKDAPGGPVVVRLELNPPQAVLEGAGTTQQLNVRAIFSDGSDRDVTRLAAFMTSNDAAVSVDAAGRTTATGRGEAGITARYEGHIAGMQVLAIPRDLAFTWPGLAQNNYIDELVDAKLRKLRIAPAGLSDDATFLRRVYLDIIGALPPSDVVRKFLDDPSPTKRTTLIDSLLARPEFADIWVMKWAELLQIRSADQQVQMSVKSAYQYYEWVEDQVTRNVPADQMVRALLTATGPSFERPEANFYKTERDTLKTAENVAQALVGVRMQCAQCHNHPFDRWTMNDYYGFAAFFAQVGRKSGEDPRETIVFNNASGGVKHPVTGKDVAPKFLGGAQPDIPKGADRRTALADWLLAPDNPWFARNLANLAWAQFFGRGLVDPVDDVRVSNPAANPELLAELARRLVGYGFDLKKLIRDICLSRTYQAGAAATGAGAEDERNFAHASVRRIRAEVLLDALGAITGDPEKLTGLPAGRRSVEIADGRTNNYFLTTFGRASRETPCSCEVRMEPNLSQALHLLNGRTVNAKITAGGLVKKLLREGRSRDAVIEELYLRVFARFPTATEKEKLATFFGDSRADEQTLNDLFWSLLNAKEFVFNH